MKKLLFLILLLFFLFPVTALAQTTEQLTAGFKITLTLSNKNTSLLTDGNIDTYISLPKAENIIISCNSASGLMLKWYETATYDATFFDANKTSIGFAHYNNSILNQYISLNGAMSLDIYLPSGGKLSDILFFTQGDTSNDTQVWEDPYKKADILVIAAHPDDEFLYMGGTIPYYGTESGLHVVVAYMTYEMRLRQDEALSALWAIGVHNYPIFVGFPDKYTKIYAHGVKYWGGEEATLGAIVELYRKYKPEVVVTHDLKGEYGHAAHILTASMALKAATAAADKTQFPESAKKYGTWQIKKLYLHLYGENKIVMNWNQPLNAYGGKTALDMAKVAYSYYKSQQKFHNQVSDTYKYSCAKFGLAFTAVGLDIKRNDFLENITSESLTNYVPKLTARPTPRPTIEPPPELVNKPTPEAMQASAVKVAVDWTTVAIVASGLFLLVLITLIIFLVRKKKRRG